MKKLNILIVEDGQIQREMLRDFSQGRPRCGGGGLGEKAL